MTPLPAAIVLELVPGWPRVRPDAIDAPALQRLKRLLKEVGGKYGFRVTCIRIPEGWELELAERIEDEHG